MKTTVNFSVWNKLKLIAEDERERKIETKIVMLKYMRDGKCSEEFNEVHKCVTQFQHNDQLRKRKCSDAYSALTKCCLTHKDYYWPMLVKDKRVSDDFFEQLVIKHKKEREQFLQDLKRN
ncbi:hypothetical protein LIER_10894 [Lithospermum erythrorhizon]|uniref:GCK domain-containing protein n=1 Tax=Lithospermum erythrorhizon TaxID=34254 RepID=A0AAV3PQC8_LITER